ncbi:Hpt domain-containing protein [Sulfurimonas sp.]|uniref:Hpt domain-containing protein n=1 Tax=Sulfurimonas sp. TaxID=2022749 RepID=UPI002AB29802|nr:Hpt domain-containing protein [Sulfurimonas sp.]
MDQLLEQFLSEARENLAFIDQNIEDIGGDDPELLNSVFRAAHTLKGGSGIVGFDSIRDITHHAEDLLDMLRDGRLEFVESMTAALYDAFDEVLNLVEAAEESEGIVEADTEILNTIVTSLSEQMGKDEEVESVWKAEFLLLEDTSSVVNMPLYMLKNESCQKLAFKNPPLSEEFCENENFYAVLFDIDESCMVYGNDPIYTLSLIGDKVLGVHSCISDNNAKSVLSGTEDADGLLLRVQLTAFIKSNYAEIEESLFNFIDELQFLPLDIQTLLSIDAGEKGHKIDSLKELSDVANDLELDEIVEAVQRSMELVGADTLQYAQLQRFIDISSFIEEGDVKKLNDFFQNLYKGEVYNIENNNEEEVVVQEVSVEEKETEEVEEEIIQSTDANIEINEHIELALTNIKTQQLQALEYIQSDDDLKRVLSMMSKIKKFTPQMPDDLSTKDEIKSFLESQLGIVTSTPEVSVEKKVEQKVEKSLNHK